MASLDMQQGGGSERERRLDELRSLDVLRQIPQHELELLLDMSVFRAIAPGTVLTSEGSVGRHCYFILSGTLWSFLYDRSGHEVPLGLLGRGDCCGVGPLFSSWTRRTTLRSVTSCYLLQVRRSALLSSFERLPALAAALRGAHRSRLVQATLGRVPMLSQLSPTVRYALASRLAEVHIERGAEIIREGGAGDSFYIIELGQVAVEQRGAVIAQLSEGDFFGEMSLLNAAPHNATVRALTPAELLVLPGEDFARLLMEQPDVLQQVREVALERVREAAAVRADEQRANEIEIMVEHGLMRGKHLLVRRPSQCPPGCRICEEACASRFGQPRLHIDNVTFGDLDVPDACRQCQFGAECIEACPEDAITWDESGALFINDSCSGCGECVPACPYDAIQLVGRERPRRGWSQHAPDLLMTLWQRLSRQETPSAPPLVADKCDLCHGYGDRACLSRCPTGSLQLIPVEELFRLQEGGAREGARRFAPAGETRLDHEDAEANEATQRRA